VPEFPRSRKTWRRTWLPFSLSVRDYGDTGSLRKVSRPRTKYTVGSRNDLTQFAHQREGAEIFLSYKYLSSGVMSSAGCQRQNALVRDQVENLEHHGCAYQGRVSGLIVRWGDFYDIAADEIQSA
jgi:hypothetical protein